MNLCLSRLTIEMNHDDFNKKVFSLKDKLYRFALRFLQDSDDALDLVQETMIKLWNKRKELNSVNSIESFAIKITKNGCFDLLKHKRITRNKEAEIIEYSNSQCRPINEAVEKLEFVRSIINSLPETQRMVIQLRDIEELELNEIKEITGLNDNAIRANLSRARKKVRDEINNIYSYGLERAGYNN